MHLELLTEGIEYTAAVGIVKCRDKWLLGLSKASDDRCLMWCFPGGGIKPGETPERAAVREVREESGVKCKAKTGVIKDNRKKHVAFVLCTADSTSQNKIKPNSEFAALAFFTVKEMKGLKLYNNVLDLINRVKR